MATLRVLAGVYKGRAVSFPDEGAPGADVTTQKVKKALFDIVGPAIGGAAVLDLFCGSGQLTLEALSRGAGLVVANDIDRRRADRLSKQIDLLGARERAQVTALPYERLLARCRTEGRRFDFIIADPPYVKRKGAIDVYDTLIAELADAAILESDGMLAVQHFTGNVVPTQRGPLSLFDQRRYGSTTLSWYRLREST